MAVNGGNSALLCLSTQDVPSQVSLNTNPVLLPELPAEVLLNIFRQFGSCVIANSKAALSTKLCKQSSGISQVAHEPAEAQGEAQQAVPSPLLIAAQVCKQWRNVIYSDSIHHVVAQGCTLTRPLPLYLSLQSIRLDGCMFTDRKTDDEEGNEEALPFEDDSAFLFSPRQGTQVSMIPFSSFPHLSRVEFSACLSMSGATIRSLCLCTALQSLSFSHIHSLWNSDLRALSQLPCLQKLEVSNCQYITSSALPYIQSIPHLRSLRFDGLAVDRDLTPISAIGLENLDILNARTFCDMHLPALAKLSTLTRLSLAGSHELSSAALTCLKPLTGLHQLSLARCRLLAGAAAACVACMHSLTALSFSGCCFLDADALGHTAKGATALHTLDLSGCIALAGPALNQLSPLACLERLSLARCFFVDSEGLRHISMLPKLRLLDVARCDRLSPAHCEPLQHAPALELLNVGDTAPMGAFCSEDWPRLSHLQISRLPFLLEEL